MSLHPSLCVLSLLGILAVASPSAASDATDSEALFEKGLANLEAGRYEQACKELAESLRLYPRPGTLYTLATCESRWGRVKTAAARFGEYLVLYKTLTPAQQKRQGSRPIVAKEEQEKLTAEIPTLTLTFLSETPVGTVVKLNGEVLATATLGVGRPMDPGEYVASTQVPGGPVLEQQITLAKREKKHVVLQVTAAPAAPVQPAKVEPPVKVQAPLPKPVPAFQPAPPVANGMSGRRKAAYVTGGIGVAGLVVGGVTGGLALGKKSIVDQHCGSGIKSADKTACDLTGLDAANSLKTLGLVSTIGFVVGLAGVGTSAVLFLTERKPSSPKVGDGGAWISVGVLSGGELVGAQGVW